jgi:peptidyl-prolyl cis-trans isomerase C
MRAPAIASINGVPLHDLGEALDDATLRQRACTELLRQAAVEAGFDDASAGEAIERLLERDVRPPEPDEGALRRHYDAQPARWGRGDRLHLRHVLFAVTPGVDLRALRHRAEALLLELRCAEPGSDIFAVAAREWSNCPSGAGGGDLGRLTRDDCAPEFGQQVFAQPGRGVLPRLVHSRHGLHVVEVLEREAADGPAFDDVRAAVAASLRRQAWAQALRQYLQRLAGGAVIEGVRLDAAETPLVQ